MRWVFLFLGLVTWVFLPLGLVTAAVISLMGPRGAINGRRPLILVPDMVKQPRYSAQGASPFFADGRAMRTPPAGTVAFGGGDYDADAGSPRQNPDYLQEDDAFYRGKRGAAFVQNNPLKITMPLLRRGQERYDIFCAPCHGATGTGNGIMTQFGMVGVASITDDLHRLMPDGEYFSVITNGKNRMMPYAPQVKVADRWAIVAYIRALMRSRSGTPDDVPEALRRGVSR
jgi:mono/diheme cytochrome c family protein